MIKKLYFEYFMNIHLTKTRFSTTTKPIEQSVDTLLTDGNPEPFFKVVETILKEHHSNRDEIAYAEKHLQTLIIGLLCPYESYFIHSEYESARTYPDIFLERLANGPIEFDIVFELKYVKKKDEAQLESIVEEAKIQLDGYMKSKRFDRPDMRGFYVVYFSGEVYKWAEWTKVIA
ncbi:MAG: hypothetical protein HC817_14140 [Saprospiraceae bacterium]|nr:hypothetical protein [Saprospiraceae bacterium]